MGRGRCDGGSPGGHPAEARPFPFVLLRGERALSGCWDPQCSPRRVWWSSPAAAEGAAVGRCAGGSGGDAFTGGSFSSWQHRGPSSWGAGSDICTMGCWRPSSPLGMEAAGTSPDLRMHPALRQPWSPNTGAWQDGIRLAAGRDAPHRMWGLCGAAPCPPLGEHRSAPRQQPLAGTTGPGSVCPNCPAPVAVGALLFFDMTLEHKQLCSSSPSHSLITLCLTRRIRRKGLNFESASTVLAHRREKQLYPFKTGVVFHTSSNPGSNLCSLPSTLPAPHTGRAGRMLPAPVPGSFLPDPALQPIRTVLEVTEL